MGVALHLIIRREEGGGRNFLGGEILTKVGTFSNYETFK
jgi:hypothetical protein